MRQGQRQKNRGLYFSVFKMAANFAEGIELSVGIDEHADIKAAFSSCGQGGCELQADSVGFDDVAGEEDRIFGGVDGCQHGRIGLLAIVQNGHFIAVQQRPAGDGIGQGDQGLAGAAGWELFEIGRVGRLIDMQPMHPLPLFLQFASSGADAIDA